MIESAIYALRRDVESWLVGGGVLEYRAWSFVAPILRRLPKDKGDARAMILYTDAVQASGLLELSGQKHTDQEFSADDLNDVIRVVDAFWSDFLGPGSASNLSMAAVAPTESADLVDPDALHDFAQCLTKSLALPKSIDEWRRQEYLTELGQMMDLASGTLRIKSRNREASECIQLALQQQPILAAMARARVLLEQPQEAHKLTANDLIELCTQSRVLATQLQIAEGID